VPSSCIGALVHIIGAIEERQVAPTAARVNAILDDIKDVTSTMKDEAGRAEWVISSLVDSVQRWRRKATAREPYA
jgi:hypothetical protein